jgi:hypothetical protein
MILKASPEDTDYLKQKVEYRHFFGRELKTYMGYSFLFFNVKCKKFSLSKWFYSKNIQPIGTLEILENVTILSLEEAQF